ncbi:MAG TPA: SDR family oxidoreductase [Acidimicrobiia bacterium]|nr:SDR family oxidoreductase [Acidimicrobiia bacterium]
MGDGDTGYSVQGKTVLVTGASSGIGAALAEGFAAAGATVGICARRKDRLAAVLARLREHAPESRSWTVDLADLDGIAEFAAGVVDEMGGVDVLVNNAGIPKRRRVQDLTPAVVESVMAINYYSPVRLTLALLPQLTARAGRIVNISSVAARFGPPSEAAYSASKAALTAWSESMQVDLAVGDSGVRVHVVNPGVIDTDLFHLPDNEESMADLEALPTTAMIQPVLEALAHDTFETYVPDWFAGIVGTKFGDTGAFLEGSIAWARAQQPGA